MVLEKTILNDPKAHSKFLIQNSKILATKDILVIRFNCLSSRKLSEIIRIQEIFDTLITESRVFKAITQIRIHNQKDPCTKHLSNKELASLLLISQFFKKKFSPLANAPF